MTRAVVGIAKPLGISVHDHIIVGGHGHASRGGLRLIWDGSNSNLHCVLTRARL